MTLRRAKEGERLGKSGEGHVLRRNQSRGEEELIESGFVPWCLYNKFKDPMNTKQRDSATRTIYETVKDSSAKR